MMIIFLVGDKCVYWTEFEADISSKNICFSNLMRIIFQFNIQDF